MLKSKTTDRVCCVAMAVMIAVSLVLWGLVEPVRGDGSHTVGYEDLLFDQSRVHTIEITMDGWDEMIANAAAEEYTDCNIVVDGEKYNHVAIRPKGNTSLSSVSPLGSTRYSFKVEFDHFVEGMTYHGLDKLSLNNLIQDATMMKDYLAYTLMNRMGVPSSLCSYVQITVNGEAWGLYLAVEGVEDGFMDRNGLTKGELYKPDSLSFGGGRGNGGGFDIEKFRVNDDEESGESEDSSTQPDSAGGGGFGGFGGFGDFSGMPSGMPDGMPGNLPEGMSGGMPQMPEGFAFGGFGGFNFGMGSEDVKLIYSDDDPDSYSNIFNNAKTKIKTKDKTRLIESLRKLNAQEDIESVVNTDEVITYLAVHNFLCNDDSYTGMMVHNYYLYEENGKLSILPWDYNLAFGGFSASGNATSTVNSPIDSPVSGGTVDSRPLIAWIFSDDEALAAYHETYSRFIAENIESGWLEQEIARVQEMITPYLENDASAFYDMDAFNKAVDTLQTFCAKRGESIRGQLEGTIPSTSDGQRSSDALVDASEISTGDMGSMNSSRNSDSNGGGFTMPGGMPGDTQNGGFTMPEGFSMPGTGASFGGTAETSASPETTAQPAETSSPDEASQQTDAPTRSDRRQSPPSGMSFSGFEQTNQSEQWIQAAICAALLLISRFRAHNQ